MMMQFTDPKHNGEWIIKNISPVFDYPGCKIHQNIDPIINVSNYLETISSFENPQGICKGFEQHQSYGQGNCIN